MTTPSPNPPVDAYELRVKLYSLGWDKSNFASFSETQIKLCKFEHNENQLHYVGVYIEVNLTVEGGIKPGAAYYFLHGDGSCPKPLTKSETHWLMPAESPADKQSVDPYYSDDDGFPWGKEVLVKSYSEAGPSVGAAGYVYQTQHQIVKINGCDFRTSTLLEAIALASFVTIPFKTILDLEKIAELSPSDMFERYCSFRASLT
jgi:hypothetical protein